MESSEDKQWAAKYLLDPLTAPEPNDVTGPGSSHTYRTPSKSSRKPVPSASTRSSTDFSEKNGILTPPGSTRSERFPDFDGSYKPNRYSTTTDSSYIPTSTNGVSSTTSEGTGGTRPRRTSSLRERYPGDQSVRPLDMLKQSDKAAHRSPHLRRKHHIGADTIDSLDTITGTAYHHEGPYDAALMARNRGAKNPPLAAVARGNAEALKATPREKVLDSLQRHYPLDGVAAVPPGHMDREGRYYYYEEGTDMMRENNPAGGAYKRWQHVDYLPTDLKGKGEPSYSLEKALKTHKRNISEGGTGGNSPRSYEMMPSPTTATTTGHHRPRVHHRSSSTGAVSSYRIPEGAESYVDWERGGSARKAENASGGRLSKRMGHLRRGS